MCDQFDQFVAAWWDSGSVQDGEAFEAMMDHPTSCDVCWRELLRPLRAAATVTDWSEEVRPVVNKAAMRRPSKWNPSPLRESISARHVTVAGAGAVARGLRRK
jgi:hypothetical protein